LRNMATYVRAPARAAGGGAAQWTPATGRRKAEAKLEGFFVLFSLVRSGNSSEMNRREREGLREAKYREG
jgi:hypothetical protein